MLRRSLFLLPGLAISSATATEDSNNLHPRLHHGKDALPFTSFSLLTKNEEAMAHLAPYTGKNGLLPGPIESLTARAYFENPLIGLGVHHFASGHITKQVSATEYLIDMEEVHLSPIAEVCARVWVRKGRTATNPGRMIGGIVGRINSNGTIGVLLDNNEYVTQVSQEDVHLVEGRSRFTLEKAYHTLSEWIRDAGVARRADRERICCMLYQRGWRAEKMYMLTANDIHCMVYIPKAVRMVVLEKAEWQKVHHAEMRGLLRERVKEREWRYFVQKFSGFVSANWAGLGVMSVFLWNFKNYRRQQRSFQLKHAVNMLTHEEGKKRRGEGGRDRRPFFPQTHSTNNNNSSNSNSHHYEENREGTHDVQDFVEREVEISWARQVLRHMNITHPRIAVLTGYRGCGKSALLRAAVRKEHKPTLFVEVRGDEDTLSCVVKAMRVPNVEACGDTLEFITDTFRAAAHINGEPPILVITLREGSELSRVYNESVVLACDRRLCHVVYEVPLEALTVENTSLPRVDFYHVPNFTPRQAFQYTEHAIDPVSMSHFLQVMGTNSNDIDEVFAAVLHRHVSLQDYTNGKLAKAMRQVQAAWDAAPGTRQAVKLLSEADFYEGQHSGGESLAHPALREIVLYDPVHSRWLFTHKVFHTATRCCF